MPRSPQQIALLAQETVRALLRYLVSARPIEEFVERYAVAFQRQGLLESPFRHRELITTLTREALVAITARVNTEMPRRLMERKGASTEAEEKQFETFREEFYLELARAMHWTPLELEEFWGDVELYAQMGPPAAGLRGGAANSVRSKPKKAPVAGPFADRCALLLDPSLLEKARQSAVALHAQLETATEKTLTAVFRPQRM